MQSEWEINTHTLTSFKGLMGILDRLTDRLLSPILLTDIRGSIFIEPFLTKKDTQKLLEVVEKKVY